MTGSQGSARSVRFVLIDRIVELEPGRKITAIKNLSLAEEYLADHFPSFPVMPGVLMLEALAQAGAWLVRVSDDFAHPVVLLREARSVKYGNFVEPGETLTVSAEILAEDGRLTTLKGQGSIASGTAVSARIVLERYDLAESDPQRAAVGAELTRHLRAQFEVLSRQTPDGARESGAFGT